MLLLASFVEQIQNTITGLGDFFADFKVIYAFEWIFFFSMIYYVSKILRENDATKLMIAYWAILIFGAVMLYAEPEIFSKAFFLAYVLMVSALMLIFFNVEVKKMLWDVHRTKGSLVERIAGNSSEGQSVTEVERCIGDIIKAVQNMSKSKTGALIVLSRGSLPKNVLDSGVKLEANISAQLIESVFFPNSPLHDGALIIRGHKVHAAGCFLPLTQKTSYPKEFGTRHRAGIGITEVANVVALVVSEETGIISIVKQGNVERFPDTEHLTKALRDYYWQELPLTEKKSKAGLVK
ncbi:MAG: DNA integrity scanning protein DisA nucleotide-binding domain protein [Clostridia bacterium]|nr:DNA integrity scanning protein DisA nucleotide-binding domain protein [Clostridia bacterium]